MKPYAILSDLHFHGWSQFASVDRDGVNTRLRGLIKEVIRAAQELRGIGGNTIFLAGDIFHTRGSIEPLILNTVMDLFRALVSDGFKVFAIPGNHDLATKKTERLHNAAAALEDCGVCMVNNPNGHTVMLEAGKQYVHMTPWHEDLAVLRMQIDAIDADVRSITDLILHAPIDGVIKGIPEHGLDPEWLASLGFRNVFAGHYHHHKECTSHVWSIGALAHHTWSDVGTKAGFLIVSDNVSWRKSHLPQFVDITEDIAAEELPLLVDQNYARAKISGASLKETEALRQLLLDSGAKGVIIQSIKAPTKVREGAVVKSGETLAASVGAFVAKHHDDATYRAEIEKECRDVMLEAGVM